MIKAPSLHASPEDSRVIQYPLRPRVYGTVCWTKWICSCTPVHRAQREIKLPETCNGTLNMTASPIACSNNAHRIFFTEAFPLICWEGDQGVRDKSNYRCCIAVALQVPCRRFLTDDFEYVKLRACSVQLQTDNSARPSKELVPWSATQRSA